MGGVPGSMIGFTVIHYALIAVVAVILVLFVIETVWSVRQARRTPEATFEALRKHDRAAGSLGRAAAIGGYFVGVVMLVVMVPPEPTARVLETIPLTVAGVVALVTLIVVERHWPAPGGTVRSADLVPRRIRDILPRAGGAVAGVAAVAWLVCLVVAGVLGGAVERDYGSAVAELWPTWVWNTPTVVGVIVIVVLAVVGARRLLRRPALAGFDRATDLTYRRAAMDRVLRVVAAACFLDAAFTVGQVGNALMRAGAYSAASAANWSSLVIMLVALLSIWVLRSRPPRQVPPPAAPNTGPVGAAPTPRTVTP